MSFDIEENNIKKILEHQKNIPVPIIKLANSFNIQVYRVSNMANNVSGAIINDNGIYSIYVNAKETEHRRRFTIAHEISHFLLHRNIIEDELDGNLTEAKGSNGVMYRSKLYDVFEKDANKLAAEILIPLNKIQELSGSNLPSRIYVGRVHNALELISQTSMQYATSPDDLVFLYDIQKTDNKHGNKDRYKITALFRRKYLCETQETRESATAADIADKNS